MVVQICQSNCVLTVIRLSPNLTSPFWRPTTLPHVMLTRISLVVTVCIHRSQQAVLALDGFVQIDLYKFCTYRLIMNNYSVIVIVNNLSTRCWCWLCVKPNVQCCCLFCTIF